MKHEVIETEKASFPVSLMCRCLEISRSGFYAARQRPVSRRTRENELMTQRIQSCYTRSRETYGSPRIYHDLREEGWAVGRHRVARLMKASGLRAIPPRRWRCTTDSKHSLPVAENVLARDFEVTDLNRVWAGDITYIWTWEGWLYLAVILDLASRRAIGWSMADHLRTELPLGALDMALGQREVPSHLLHHSDRGSQYASRSYQERLREHGILALRTRDSILRWTENYNRQRAYTAWKPSILPTVPRESLALDGRRPLPRLAEPCYFMGQALRAWKECSRWLHHCLRAAWSVFPSISLVMEKAPGRSRIHPLAKGLN